LRLDKFLQISRLVRRRAMAHALCETGHVRLNGTPAKPSASVKSGDVITIAHHDRRLVAKVVRVPDRPAASKELVQILGRITLHELTSGQA
jgi:ribosomal 50S subunit-recycling heat shock protein